MIIFVAFKYFSVLLCSFEFESDVEAEFIDLIEYTAKICNKAVSLSGIIQHIKIIVVAMKDSVTYEMQILAVTTSKKSLSSKILKYLFTKILFFILEYFSGIFLCLDRVYIKERRGEKSLDILICFNGFIFW